MNFFVADEFVELSSLGIRFPALDAYEDIDPEEFSSFDETSELQ